jgi:hypothetical protein
LVYRFAKFYVAMMKQVVDKAEAGNDFIRSEFARVSKLVTGSTLTAEKETELAQRLNILGSMKDIVLEAEVDAARRAETAN